jgi:hypothetical protein
VPLPALAFRRPLASASGALSDSLMSLGFKACLFLLRASNRPLSWLERRLRRPLRAHAMAWVIRRAARG